MRNLYKALLILSFSFLMSSSATAFEGFSVGVTATSADFTTEGKELEGGGTISTTDGEETSGTASKSADFGSVFAEYTFAQGSTFGISYVPGDAEIGTKSRTDTQSDTNETSDDSGTYTGKAEISDHYTVYIEPTLMANENFGFFVTTGVSRVTVNSLESITFGENSSAYGSEDVWGVMYGLGVKAVHENGLFAKISATKTEYDTVVLTSSSGNKNTIHADPETESVNLSIGYNF